MNKLMIFLVCCSFMVFASDNSVKYSLADHITTVQSLPLEVLAPAVYKDLKLSTLNAYDRDIQTELSSRGFLFMTKIQRDLQCQLTKEQYQRGFDENVKSQTDAVRLAIMRDIQQNPNVFEASLLVALDDERYEALRQQASVALEDAQNEEMSYNGARSMSALQQEILWNQHQRKFEATVLRVTCALQATRIKEILRDADRALHGLLAARVSMLRDRD